MNIIWLIILIIDGLDAFFGKRVNAKKQKEVLNRDSIPKKKEVLKSKPQNFWSYLFLEGLLEIVWATLLKVQLLGGPLFAFMF